MNAVVANVELSGETFHNLLFSIILRYKGSRNAIIIIIFKHNNIMAIMNAVVANIDISGEIFHYLLFSTILRYKGVARISDWRAKIFEKIMKFGELDSYLRACRWGVNSNETSFW